MQTFTHFFTYKKTKTMKTKTIENNRCGNCRHPTPCEEEWNRALDGHYIAMTCRFCNHKVLKGDKPCNHFAPRPKHNNK